MCNVVVTTAGVGIPLHFAARTWVWNTSVRKITRRADSLVFPPPFFPPRQLLSLIETHSHCSYDCSHGMTQPVTVIVYAAMVVLRLSWFKTVTHWYIMGQTPAAGTVQQCTKNPLVFIYLFIFLVNLQAWLSFPSAFSCGITGSIKKTANSVRNSGKVRTLVEVTLDRDPGPLSLSRSIRSKHILWSVILSFRQCQQKLNNCKNSFRGK